MSLAKYPNSFISLRDADFATLPDVDTLISSASASVGDIPLDNWLAKMIINSPIPGRVIRFLAEDALHRRGSGLALLHKAKPDRRVELFNPTSAAVHGVAARVYTMKPGDRFRITSRNIIEPPLPLQVPRSFLSDQFREGDIITLSDETGGRIHEATTGFPVSTEQRFVIVAKEDDPV